MREIEVYRCWDDHTWDTAFVEISDHTPNDKIGPAAEHAALESLRNSHDLPVMVGVYHIPDPEEDDRCVCEQPGHFCSGVPGILAHMADTKVEHGGQPERCDVCERYPSDDAARQKLSDLGLLCQCAPCRTERAAVEAVEGGGRDG